MQTTYGVHLSIILDGRYVTIYDNEGYQQYNRQFQLEWEAEQCYDITVKQLQTFQQSLVGLGWSDIPEVESRR